MALYLIKHLALQLKKNTDISEALDTTDIRHIRVDQYKEHAMRQGTDKQNTELTDFLIKITNKQKTVAYDCLL